MVLNAFPHSAPRRLPQRKSHSLLAPSNETPSSWPAIHSQLFTSHHSTIQVSNVGTLLAKGLIAPTQEPGGSSASLDHGKGLLSPNEGTIGGPGSLAIAQFPQSARIDLELQEGSIRGSHVHTHVTGWKDFLPHLTWTLCCPPRQFLGSPSPSPQSGGVRAACL